MSHYDVLGVGQSADEVSLRKAYLRLARVHHPDRAGGSAAEMQRVNEAWATLGDPVRRAAYDRSLRAPSPPPQSARPAPSSVRPGYEPDPRYDPTDDDEWADLEDDRPYGGTVVLPRWMKLVPVGALVGSVALFLAGGTFGSEPLRVLGLMGLAVATMLFLAAPFMALLASKRGAGSGSDL